MGRKFMSDDPIALELERKKRAKEVAYVKKRMTIIDKLEKKILRNEMRWKRKNASISL